MRFSRTRLLIGEEGLERLRKARAAILGLGGVGSFAFEAIVRAGVGRITVVDFDVVEPSNINRQLLALDGTVGRPKVEVAVERAAAINPDAVVEPIREFVSAENLERLLPSGVEYAIDAIDTLDSKVCLILELLRRGIRFVSCMGAARRMNPAGVRVADIGKTTHCPLARRMRALLRTHGVKTGVRCVYSEEAAVPLNDEEKADGDSVKTATRGKRPQGSLSYVPGIIGLTAAGLIINDILQPDASGQATTTQDMPRVDPTSMKGGSEHG